MLGPYPRPQFGGLGAGQASVSSSPRDRNTVRLQNHSVPAQSVPGRPGRWTRMDSLCQKALVLAKRCLLGGESQVASGWWGDPSGAWLSRGEPAVRPSGARAPGSCAESGSCSPASLSQRAQWPWAASPEGRLTGAPILLGGRSPTLHLFALRASEATLGRDKPHGGNIRVWGECHRDLGQVVSLLRLLSFLEDDEE